MKDLNTLRKLAVLAIEQDRPIDVVGELVDQVNKLQDQYTADHPAY